ncbi:DoxX family protein [bacterium]|nr:DoxX family protein [bacterium]
MNKTDLLGNKKLRFVEQIEEPKITKTLFGRVNLAWLWLIVRVYLGWEWLQAGLGKIGNPAWTGSNAGAAINGFVSGALQKTTGEHPDVQSWYAWFLEKLVLPNTKVFGYMVAYGEVLVGIALIIGLFAGIAAFFGGFMNMNYLLSGAISVNPILLFLSLFVILAWRTAGWWGLDRWVLPALGTPWRPGFVFEGEKPLAPIQVEKESI